MKPSSPLPPNNSMETNINSKTYLSKLLRSTLHIPRILIGMMSKGLFSIRFLDLSVRSIGSDTKDSIMVGTLNWGRKHLRHVCVVVTEMYCTGSRSRFFKTLPPQR